MRLDKYLKVSRLIKRRTVANEACDSGRVLINDKPAKASANVKEGDIISCDIVAELNGFMGDNTKTFRVGKVSDEADRLLRVTEEALYRRP